MADQKSKFLKKVSPLIEGQVPDFVQADHPVFVDFVKDYFSFLEAGRLTLTQTINYITLETNTSTYVIDEQDEEELLQRLVRVHKVSLSMEKLLLVVLLVQLQLYW